MPARVHHHRQGEGTRHQVRLLLLWALVACGPVATTTEPTPAEVVARQAVVAALRVALAETCRATVPAEGARALLLGVVVGLALVAMWMLLR